MEDLRTAQRMLGVDHRATRQDVTRAYRRAAKRHHPDAGGDASAFRALDAAYRLALQAARQPTHHPYIGSLADARPNPAAQRVQVARPRPADASARLTRQARVTSARPTFAELLERELARH